MHGHWKGEELQAPVFDPQRCALSCHTQGVDLALVRSPPPLWVSWPMDRVKSVPLQAV